MESQVTRKDISCSDIDDRIFVVGKKLREFEEFLNNLDTQDNSSIAALKDKQRRLHQLKSSCEAQMNQDSIPRSEAAPESLVAKVASMEIETHKFEEELAKVVPEPRH